MKLITFGFGATAAFVLSLGFGSAPPVQGGSYVTLGQGQSASKFAMLGLSPGAAVQPPADIGGGGFFKPIRIPVDQLQRMKLERDDELLLFIAAAAVSTDMLN